MAPFYGQTMISLVGEPEHLKQNVKILFLSWERVVQTKYLLVLKLNTLTHFYETFILFLCLLTLLSQLFAGNLCDVGVVFFLQLTQVLVVLSVTMPLKKFQLGRQCLG